MKKETVVFISSGQPSSNPRLVKEANFLSEIGLEVFVIYSYWIQWAYLSDKELFKSIKWKPLLVGGTPFNVKILYYLTRFRFKLFNWFCQNISLKFGIAEIAKGRAYPEMLLKAKSIKADLYIAHNLAALPIAVKAAKLNSAKCGFDAEDFHRQEVTDDIHSFEYRSAKYIEDKYLPKVDYLTAASPLIAKEYKKLYPHLHPVVINNVFPKKYIKNSQFSILNSQLKLFWFSQTIGKGRGIEDVISALSILKNENIELHLLGNASQDTKDYFISLNPSTKIYFYNPIPPDDVFEFASQFDIGLALEQKIPYNRDICLTNKIFTYLTSGLAILATETTAQKQFMCENPEIGSSFEIGNITQIAEKIIQFYVDKNYLIKCKEEALRLANKEYNWEIESEKFIKIVNQVVHFQN